jgi:hypothetical protein
MLNILVPFTKLLKILEQYEKVKYFFLNKNEKKDKSENKSENTKEEQDKE